MRWGVPGRGWRYSCRFVVLNATMNRFRILVAATACALAAGAAIALAATSSPYASGSIELGTASGPVPPSCPTSCRVMTRTTGLEVLTEGHAYPTTAPANGRIVAFTVRLGSLPKKSLIHSLNVTYGGTPRLAIAVLHPGKSRKFTLKAQSDIVRISPWLGKTVEFPLSQSLPIAKGDVVALTVPTWAPVLAENLSKSNAWRASRPGHCLDYSSQTAQLVANGAAQYRCYYNTERLTYTATFIATPKTPPAPKKK